MEPAAQWYLIRAVAISPDGAFVAVGFHRRSVGVWTSDGKAVEVLRHTERDRVVGALTGPRDTLVSSVTISRDNRYVFAGFADMTAAVWDRQAGEVVFEAGEHSEDIMALHVSRERLSWATSGGTIWSCELDGGSEPIKGLGTDEQWIEATFSADGRDLLARTKAEVRLVSLEDGSRVLGALSDKGLGIRERARTLGFVSAATRFYPVAAASLDPDAVPKARNAPRSLDMPHDLVVLDTGGHASALDRDSKIDRVIPSPAGDVLATTGWSDRVELWSVPEGGFLRSLECDSVSSSSVTFSHDGSLVAFGALGQVTHDGLGGKREIVVYRVEDGERVVKLTGHDHQVHYLGFGPDNEWLASAGLDRTLRLWSLKRGLVSRLGKELVCHKLSMIWDMRVLSDGRVLVFGDRGVQVWDRLRKITQEMPTSISYDTLKLVSDDERWLFLSQRGQGVEQWDLSTGARVQTFEPPIVKPDTIPTPEMHDHDPQAGALVWRAPGGPFLHVGDGPRGWATPIKLSAGHRTVLPCSKKALVLALEKEPALVGTIHFSGRLRASCVTPSEALAVNSKGKIFRAALPGQD